MSEELILKEISIDDDFEGLIFLQELVSEEGIMVSPAPKDIDGNSYKDWLKSKVDLSK